MIKSLLTENNHFNSSAEIETWIRQRNEKIGVDVQLIPFAEIDGREVSVEDN